MKVMIWMTLLSNREMPKAVGKVWKLYQIDGYSLEQEQAYRNGGLLSGIDIERLNIHMGRLKALARK